jgi:hypothetical protein
MAESHDLLKILALMWLYLKELVLVDQIMVVRVNQYFS